MKNKMREKCLSLFKLIFRNDFFTLLKLTSKMTQTIQIKQLMSQIAQIFDEEYQKSERVRIYFLRNQFLKKDRIIIFKPIFIEFYGITFQCYANMDKFYATVGNDIAISYRINNEFYHSLKDTQLNMLNVDTKPVNFNGKVCFSYRVEAVNHISQNVVDKILHSDYNRPIPDEGNDELDLLRSIHLD